MIIGIPGTLYNRILTLLGLFLSLQPFSSQFLQIKGSIDWHKFNPIIPRIICWASFVCMHLSYFSQCSFVFVHFLLWKIQIGSLKSETSDFWIIVSWQGFCIRWFGGRESGTGRAVLARPRHVAIWLPHKSWFGTESINMHVNTSTLIELTPVVWYYWFHWNIYNNPDLDFLFN